MLMSAALLLAGCTIDKSATLVEADGISGLYLLDTGVDFAGGPRNRIFVQKDSEGLLVPIGSAAGPGTFQTTLSAVTTGAVAALLTAGGNVGAAAVISGKNGRNGPSQVVIVDGAEAGAVAGAASESSTKVGFKFVD